MWIVKIGSWLKTLNCPNLLTYSKTFFTKNGLVVGGGFADSVKNLLDVKMSECRHLLAMKATNFCLLLEIYKS